MISEFAGSFVESDKIAGGFSSSSPGTAGTAGTAGGWRLYRTTPPAPRHKLAVQEKRQRRAPSQPRVKPWETEANTNEG
jgi:hypothetical protein